MPASTPSKMYQTQEAPYTNTPHTLLGLPSELRLQIFGHIFTSTVLYTQRGRQKPDGTCDSDALSVPPQLPWRVNLVCRAFNTEIGTSWHSQVTYHFPSTVALLDVLIQWPRWKLEQVRHVHIVGTLLPLYPYRSQDSYVSHSVAAALPVLPGLQLDVLTVENIWLHPNGNQVDGWCLAATFDDVHNLLQSGGWKELRYLSGVLGFTPAELRELESQAQDLRTQRAEPDFEYWLGRVRPQLSGLRRHHPDGTVTSLDSEEDREEVKQWYLAHPGEPEDSLPEEGMEKEVVVRAVRGAKAQYRHDGQGRAEVIRELLENVDWLTIRANSVWLVDDGVDDPCGHL